MPIAGPHETWIQFISMLAERAVYKVGSVFNTIFGTRFDAYEIVGIGFLFLVILMTTRSFLRR